MVLAGGKFLGIRTGNDHRPRRHAALVDHRLGAGNVDDVGGLRQHDIGAQYGLALDAHAFDHDAARPDKTLVFDDRRRSLRRLQHATDAHAAAQVHVPTDLGARSHCGPGVDHGAAADPGADVHIAGHHDRARLQKAAVARNGVRHDPDAQFGVVALERNLIVEFEGRRLDRFHLLDREIEDDGLFHPFVDLPPAVSQRLGHTQAALVEVLDHFANGGLRIGRFQLFAVRPGGFYCFLQCFHRDYFAAKIVYSLGLSTLPKGLPKANAFKIFLGEK